MWAQLLLGAFFLQVSVSSGLHPCTLPVHQRGRGPEHYYHHDQLLTKIKAIEVKDEHGIDGLDDENYELLQEASGAWMERARQLLAFKRVNGHTRVPKRFKENPALGNWVNKQRQ